jgi:hypothetical protein
MLQTLFAAAARRDTAPAMAVFADRSTAPVGVKVRSKTTGGKMCGSIIIGSHSLNVDCFLIDPYWWLHPWPPIDLTQFDFAELAPAGEDRTWKVELTQIGNILSTAAHLSDRELGRRLGSTAAEIGNSIAGQAQVKIAFDWVEHDQVA